MTGSQCDYLHVHVSHVRCAGDTAVSQCTVCRRNGGQSVYGVPATRRSVSVRCAGDTAVSVSVRCADDTAVRVSVRCADDTAVRVSVRCAGDTAVSQCH